MSPFGHFIAGYTQGRDARQARHLARDRERQLRAEVALSTMSIPRARRAEEREKTMTMLRYTEGRRPDLVARYGPLFLYEDALVSIIPDRVGVAAIHGVTAAVSEGGHVAPGARGTLPRSILFAGWQKDTSVDTRTVWMTINGPTFQWVTPAAFHGRNYRTDLPPEAFASLVTTLGRAALRTGLPRPLVPAFFPNSAALAPDLGVTP